MSLWTSLRGRQWHPTPVLLPGKSHGQKILVGCSPWGRSESDTTEQFHFHFSLSCTGEGNGNHSSVLAWRIPGTVEPGGLPSMGSHSQTRLKRLSSSSRWLNNKESACNARDLGSIPESERFPGEGNSNPLQDSCLENSMDRGSWWGTVHGVKRVGHDLVTKPLVSF